MLSSPRIPDFARLPAAEVLAAAGHRHRMPGEDLHLLPHVHGTDGFYAAVLERTGVRLLLLALRWRWSRLPRWAVELPATGTVEVLFTPWDDAEGALLREIGEARTQHPRAGLPAHQPHHRARPDRRARARRRGARAGRPRDGGEGRELASARTAMRRASRCASKPAMPPHTIKSCSSMSDGQSSRDHHRQLQLHLFGAGAQRREPADPARQPGAGAAPISPTGGATATMRCPSLKRYDHEYRHNLSAACCSICGKTCQQPEVVWQVGVLIACFALAWVFDRWLQGACATSDDVESRARHFGQRGLKRIGLPLVMLLLVLAARPLLAHWHHVNLLSWRSRCCLRWC